MDKHGAQSGQQNLEDSNKWRELAKSSLKGQDLERILNHATLEGVNYKGLYERNDKMLQLLSFPEKFTASTIYDSGLANSEEILEDQKEGMDSCLLVVRGKNWKRKFPDKFNASFLLQMVEEDFLSEFEGENAFVDSNKLAFASFDKEVERVKRKGLGFAINMSRAHNAGASVAQEISYGLNIFNRLLELGADEKKIFFMCAVDSLFFMNIAKLRALRFLAEEILSAHGKEPRPYIVAASSLREQTLYDPWVNMLRNCSSSMAAVLGGADEVAARPHDSAYSALTEEPSSPLARRSARHILNIVREESKLHFTKDSAKGGFAVEEISCELAEQAWENFLNWEEQDLFLNARDFAKSVEAIAKARYEKTRKRKKVITGINDFANNEETLEGLYGKPWRPVDLWTGLFPLRRNAYEFEELRLALEKSNVKLKGAVVYKGQLSALSGRINFVKNVLETLGMEVREFEAGKNLDKTFQEASQAGCNVLVLAGRDEEYGEWARPGDAKLFKSQFIAGKKENFELPEEAAFTDLYMGKNIYQDLKEMLKREGVEL